MDVGRHAIFTRPRAGYQTSFAYVLGAWQVVVDEVNGRLFKGDR